jgi:transposase InsO family protein
MYRATFVPVRPSNAPNRYSTIRLGLLVPVQIPERRWSSIGIGFITHLPITNTGHDSIVMFVDRLTKRVHIEPCYDTSAEAFAEVVLHTIFKQHGLPLDIVSDLDSRFSSLFWTEVYKRFGIKQNMSTAYHPLSDWQTDRVNRLLEGVLRANVSDDHSDCAEHLPLVEFAVNNSVSSENGTTPFLMDCGQEPLTPSMASLGTARQDMFR